MLRLRFITVLWILLLATGQASATHIVGGELTYKHLGNNVYQVRIDLYQDCLTGDPQAIAQDNPALIRIFSADNTYLVDSIYMSSSIAVPPNFSNECVNNPPNTCLRRATFIKNYTLPPSIAGYQIVVQRCCRNGSIVNIQNPGAVGATYTCTIPPQAVPSGINNSAQFQNYPPQIICVNNPLVYDHSATDADGDSLSYEFCQAYVGGSPNDAKPLPAPPPYIPVQYIGAYSAAAPMGGNPQIQINPASGIISGTPNIMGRFVVTVCCHEWRNGTIINTVKREFQFVVTNCSKAVVANIPQYSEEFNTYIVKCDGFTVKFDNLSSGGFAYNWDFGVLTDNNDTSTQFSPSFTYPDTGTYIVKLAVNRGSTCPDSISRIVKVYPDFQTEYEFTGLPCPNSPLQFTDLSTSTYKPISNWSWNFGDGTASNLQNPVHSYTEGGVYNVQLISRNIKGCTDTATRELEIEKFRPFAGNDTIIVKGESILFRASGGSQYTWTPPTNLSNPNIGNPVGYYPAVGIFEYNVHIKSDFGCEGNDSIRVRVVDQSAVFVPSGFTPNGDGRNDVLRPITIGYRNINYFRVFNRWGQQVFYTTRVGEGWDGRFMGQNSDVGTYFWVLSVTNRFGEEEMQKGDVTLLR